MSMRKFSKLNWLCLSGLLVACLVAPVVGLVPTAVVDALPAGELVCTRALPDVVVPGEEFDVTVTFTSPGDVFNNIGFGDEAPGATWIVSLDDTKVNPSPTITGVTANKPSILWMKSGGYSTGISFAAVYQVTVPGDATPGTYSFPNGVVKYTLGDDPAVEYAVGIGGEDQVEILQEYNLNLASTDGGSVTTPGEAGPYTYVEGTMVDLEATAETGYEFDEWTGGVGTVVDVNDATTTVTMNADYSITAEFVGITPYIVVAKSVNPDRVGQKDSGISPEETTVTLTVTGAGDPLGSLTSVVVTDVLPDYINDEGNFSIAPDSNTLNADGTTTLIWNVGTIAVGIPWTGTFDISSDDCGRVLANEYSTSSVTYDDVTLTSVTVPFLKTYLVVRCPEEAAGVSVLPPEPAKMGASNLFVNPEQVVPSQWLEISANIYNKGGTKGTRTVALVINGYMADSQTVGVSPDASQSVVFRVRADSEFLGGIYTGAGTYNVNVEGMEGQFFVLAQPEAPAPAPKAPGIGGPLGTGGIIAIVVIVIAIIVGLMFVLRRE